MNDATEAVPRTRKEIKLTAATEARFWAKVDKNGPTIPHMESQCWVWTAGKFADGYGSFGANKKVYRSSRVAWTLINGPIPDNGTYHGVCVCHRCDNPDCVNPQHFFLGTQSDNISDMTAKKRRGIACGVANGANLYPERLARGEAVAISKLTASQVAQIRTTYAKGGISHKELGLQYGVTDCAIGFIIRRKTWRHVP